MSARSWLVVAALVAVVVAGARCKRANGAYCDDARPCPSGFACDLTARECHAMIVGGGDMAPLNIDMAGCTCSSTTPICVAMTCVSCLSTSDPNAACAAATPPTPFCEMSGPDAGKCIACRDGNDCSGMTPYCDATTHVCRGCIADAECTSLICDLTPGSGNHGLCVPMSQVEYADVNAATNGNGLLPSTPRTGLQDAINHAVGGDARPYVHVAAGTYNENVGVNNKTIYLVGADGATIKPANNDALGAMGATGSLTVRNLIASAPNGNGGNCQGSAVFTAYRSQFTGASQNGVYASMCTLLLDGDWIDSNTGAGIYIGSSGSNFTIINSIISRNSNSGGLFQLGAAGTGVFANNTVADNIASGPSAGVTCATTGSTLFVRNSILWNNKGSTGSAIGESLYCMGTDFDASDDVTAGPQSTVDLTMQKPGFKGGTPITPDSYRLTLGSPCLNEASPLYAPDHDFVFLPRPDRTAMMPDIGAYELQ